MEDWMDEEQEDMSLSDLMGLVQQFEQSQQSSKPLFFDEDSYERIILFYQENREFKRALSVAETALEQYPYSPTFFILKAEVLAEQNQFEEALNILEIAETLDANEITIYLIRADIYLWTSQHKKALEQLNFALPLASEKDDFTDIYLLKADVFEDQEQYLEVIDALEEAIKADPYSEEALSRLGFAVEITEAFERSEVFHRELTESDPYNHFAWFNLGHALYYLHRFDDAIEAFEFVVAIQDDFEPAHIFLGDVWFEKEEYSKALEKYMDASKIGKSRKETFFKIAECYEQLTDFKNCRYYLRKATNIDATYDDAFYKIGETYLAENNYNQAVQSYERAVKISPENTSFLIALGNAHMLNEDTDIALSYFSKAIDLEPNVKSHYINLANGFFSAEDFNNSIDTLDLCYSLFPSATDVLYIKTVFLFQIGQRKEALATLEKAINVDTKDISLIFDMNPLLTEDDAVMLLLENYGLTDFS